MSDETLTSEAIAETTRDLAERAREAIGDPDADVRAIYELRYRGQAFELAIERGLESTPDELREAFETEHEDRYGYSDPDQTLELVTIRVTARSGGAEVELAQSESEPPEEHRRDATLAGEKVELAVVRGSPPPGYELSGPAVVELPESTLLVPEGWSGEVDESGTVTGLKRG